MYLHQFKNPKIFQYDALSSDEKWSEKFDVILANPPFMSPKGGIKPHSKFSIPSNRSEVLFVDYIMNHLRPEGRAGIIVPEGIIFQSGNAYKTLRKNLIDGGLYAVVSLPSGVFQPYSGVKTSVLLLNKKLAKQSSELLFIKIENDGFDLGAQRRSNAKNDLPQALEILQKWQIGEKLENKMASFVEKEKIAENGDYNLSGDRYRVATDYSKAKWEMVELGKLEQEDKIEFLRGQGLSKKDLDEEGSFKCIHYGEIYTLYEPIIKSVSSKTNFVGKILSKKGDVLVPATTTADAMGIAVARSLNENNVVIGGDINVIRTRNKFILADYLALLISNPPLKIDLASYAKGANILHISNNDIRNLKIPLPPLEVQEQIVRELNGYQSIIQGAKQITQNWKPKIDIDPTWPKLELGKVVSTLIPPIKLLKEDFKTEGIFPIIDQSQNEIAGWTSDERALVKSKKPLVVFGDHTCVIKYCDKPFAQGADGIKIILTGDNLIPKFLFYFLKEKPVESDGYQRHYAKLKRYIIFLPPLETQKQIVARIEEEQSLVESAKKLIEIYEQKTKATINKLWEE